MLACYHLEHNVRFEHGSFWTRVILVPVKASEAFHEDGRSPTVQARLAEQWQQSKLGEGDLISSLFSLLIYL